MDILYKTYKNSALHHTYCIMQRTICEQLYLII